LEEEQLPELPLVPVLLHQRLLISLYHERGE
jgi:hypothetical protein